MKLATLAFSLSLIVVPAAHATDPVPDAQPTLQLGTVQVQGNMQIMQALHVIKTALRTPFSDSAEHANEVVCRIDKQLGEAREYLDCATNHDYTRRRDETQMEVLKHLGDPTGADPFKALIAAQPAHRLHVPVNGAALQALLNRIPDQLAPATASDVAPMEVPAAQTQQAPASATRQP